MFRCSKLCCFLLGVLLVFTYAETPVTVDDLVMSYIWKLPKGAYRSGLTNPKRTCWWAGNRSKDLPQKSDDDDGDDKWKGALDCEYSAIYEAPDSDFVRRITKRIKHPVLSVSYNTSSNVLSLLFAQKGNNLLRQDIKRKGISDTSLEASTKIVAREHIGIFKGLVDEDNVKWYKINDTATGIQRIYCRVFRGGILPTSVSNVLVTYDADNILQKIDIKWPKFIRLKATSETIPFSDALNWAKRIYSETTQASENEIDTATILSAHIVGAAFGWKEMEGDIISPCYLFEAKTPLSDGKCPTYRIEVPRLKIYIP